MVFAQNVNNKTIKIAFALVIGVTKNGQSFFMNNMRRNVASRHDVCVISNRHEPIESAYNNPQNGWHGSGSTHVFCYHGKYVFIVVVKNRSHEDL